MIDSPCHQQGRSSSEPQQVGEIHGFADLMAKAVVAPSVALDLHREMAALGVLSIQEVTVVDWQALPAWQNVLPFAQRRVLAIVQ